MLNSEIMATPVVHESIDSIRPYFPKGGWYDLLTGLEI